MSSSVPAAGRSPFSHLARSRSKVEDQVEDDDNVVDEEDDEDDEDETDETKTKKKQKRSEEKSRGQGRRRRRQKPDARAARAREKARVRAIMNSPAGQQFPSVALGLARGTSMPRHAAIRTLSTMTKNLSPAPAATRCAIGWPASTSRILAPATARPAPNLAEQIVLAGRKRRG